MNQGLACPSAAPWSASSTSGAWNASAAALSAAGVEVVSTGSTAAALEAHGLTVTRVEELTGFPELLDGRVKTLHPRVHAGLLADRSQPGHRAALDEAGIAPFDLVVVSLYPFEETVATPDVARAWPSRRIDVGGPAMVRAAAKNHAWVAVVCDPADYPLVETALTAERHHRVRAPCPGRQGVRPNRRLRHRRRRLDGLGRCSGARRNPSAPCRAPVGERSPAAGSGDLGAPQPLVPERLTVGGRLRQALRYGENPHQGAAFYAADGPGGPWGLGTARQLAGKGCPTTTCSTPTPPWPWPPSTATGRSRSSSSTPTRAGRRSGATRRRRTPARWRATRSVPSAGLVGLSRPLDAATAKGIAGVFTEVVVAPGFDDEALAVLAGKPSLRLVQVDPARPPRWLSVRSVAGGLLAQEPDPGADDPAGWALQAGDPPGPELLADLALAWSVAAHVKSNAIVLARDGRIVGVGAGQQSRVDSVRIAVAKARAGRGRPPAATPSSRSPTASRPTGRRRRPGRGPARRQCPRPRGHRRRGGRRHDHAPQRPPPLPPLTSSTMKPASLAEHTYPDGPVRNGTVP